MAEDSSTSNTDKEAAETKKPAPKKKAATRKPAAKKTVAKKTTSAAKKSTTTAKKSASTAKKASPKKAATVKAQDTKSEDGNPEGISQDADTKAKTDATAKPASEKSSESEEENFNSTQMLEDLKSRNWGQIVTRALLMFFFGVLGTFALYISFFLAFTQVIFSIFAGAPNEKLTEVMSQLSAYLGDVISYLSFASDDLPFPFGKDVPKSDN